MGQCSFCGTENEDRSKYRIDALTEALEDRSGRNAALRRELTQLRVRLAALEDDWRCERGDSSMHDEARWQCADELRDLIANVPAPASPS